MNNALVTLPRGWVLNATGSYSTVGGDDWISGPFKILGHTLHVDTRSAGLLVEFVNPVGELVRVIVPNAEFHKRGSNFLADNLAGLGLKVCHGQIGSLGVLLSMTSVNQTIAVTSRTGWHGGKAFIYGDGTIFPTAGSAYPYHLEGADTSEKWAAKGSLADWQRDVAAHCEHSPMFATAIMAALAGPLLTPLGMHGGGFHLYGESSVGKTTALQIAGSIYGRGNRAGTGAGQVGSWCSTENALEGVAARHNDGVLILDEIGQMKPESVAAVAYLLAHGVGKSRMKADATLRQNRVWRLFALSSGEKTTGQLQDEAGKVRMAGVEMRLIDIPVDNLPALPGTLSDRAALVDSLQTAAETSYGTAGREWVGRLAANMGPAILDQLRTHMATWERAHIPRDASSQVGRVAGKFALLAAAGELAATLGILPWQQGSADAMAAETFKAWLDHRGHAGNQVAEDNVAVLRDFLQAHLNNRFQDLDNPSWKGNGTQAGYRETVRETVPETVPASVRETVPSSVPASGGGALNIDDFADPRAGRSGETHVYITGAGWKEIWKGRDSTRAAKSLVQAGILRVPGDGRLAVKRRVGGGQQRVYHVLPGIWET